MDDHLSFGFFLAAIGVAVIGFRLMLKPVRPPPTATTAPPATPLQEQPPPSPPEPPSPRPYCPPMSLEDDLRPGSESEIPTPIWEKRHRW